MEVGTPNGAHPSEAEQREAADLLEEVLQVRHLPAPPGYLLERRRATHPEEDIGASVEAAAAPHWNAAVALLREGGAGYSALLQRLTRLWDWVQDVKLRERVYAAEERGVQLALEIVRGEAERHRRDATLRSSLDFAVRSENGSDGHFWELKKQLGPSDQMHEWCCLRVPGYETLEDKDFAPLPYGISPSLSRLDSRRNPNPIFVPEAFRRFPPDWSWDTCEEHLSKTLSALIEHRPSGSLDEEAEVLAFRLAVIRQVIKEDDILGYVGYITTGETARNEAEIATAQGRPVAVTRLQYAFLEKACDLIRSPLHFESLNALFTQIRHDLSEDPNTVNLTSWYKGRLYPIAASLGMVQPKARGGKPQPGAKGKGASRRGKTTRLEQKETLKFFLAEATNWCRLHSEGMVKLNEEE